MKRSSKKGFTLMEMLIVIAIIAILIAIAIPVFTAQLNKAKKGTDQSNARSLKSLVTTSYLTKEGTPEVADGVYYMNKTANGILDAKTDALKCEGSGDGYKNSADGANDSGFIWVRWSGTAVTETNPSLETTATTTQAP